MIAQQTKYAEATLLQTLKRLKTNYWIIAIRGTRGIDLYCSKLLQCAVIILMEIPIIWKFYWFNVRVKSFEIALIDWLVR